MPPPPLAAPRAEADGAVALQCEIENERLVLDGLGGTPIAIGTHGDGWVLAVAGDGGVVVHSNR